MNDRPGLQILRLEEVGYSDRLWLGRAGLDGLLLLLLLLLGLHLRLHLRLVLRHCLCLESLHILLH